MVVKEGWLCALRSGGGGHRRLGRLEQSSVLKEEWGVVKIVENRGGRRGGAAQDKWGSVREWIGWQWFLSHGPMGFQYQGPSFRV